MVLLKNDSLVLNNFNAASSLEARTPKTLSSSVTNPASSTLVLGYYKQSVIEA
jgi:hypothetical protein